MVDVGARRRVQLLAIFGGFGSDSRDDESHLSVITPYFDTTMYNTPSHIWMI